MTAKIDWYREVLEVEPNSRVFFPLAKLLAEDGKSGEAISILEHGLDKHPEYLEARLCLIDLLYKQALPEKCDIEIKKLSEIFAEYPGFWHAWASCLANDEKQSDAAALLRFLAMHFSSGPLLLAKVINRGLDELAGESADAAPSVAADEPEATDVTVNENQTAFGDFVAHQTEMLADLDSELESGEAGSQNDETSPLQEEQEMAPIAEENQESAPDADFAAGEGAAAETLPDSAPETAQMSEQEGMEPLPDMGAASETVEQALPETGMEEEQLPEAGESSLNEVHESVEQMLPEPEPLAGFPPEAENTEPLPETAAAEEVLPEPVLENIAEALEDTGEKALPEPGPEDELLPAVEETGGESETANPELADLEDELLPGPDETQENPAEKDMAMEFPAEAAAAAPEEAEAPSIDTEAAMLADAELETSEALLNNPQNHSVDSAAAEAEAALVGALDLPDMEPAPKPGAKYDEEPADSLTDEYAEEEQFSLRTRSMAEVLAEQGDLRGALDIYQELAAAATSADELNDINQRISTLQSRLHMTSASSGFKASDEKTQAKSKEKLIGMLEALAQRVEARAQN